VKVVLGVEEIEEETLELVGVHLTYATAKKLETILSKALSHAKDEMGIVVPE